MAAMNWEIYVNKRMEGLTQRQAYIAAYPRSKTWKPEAVDVQASKLEAQPKISLRLDELRKAAAERGQVKADAIIEKLKSIAFMEKNTNKRGAIKYKAPDVLNALKLLGAHLGMWQKNVNLTGTVNTNPFKDLTAEELKKLAEHG